MFLFCFDELIVNLLKRFIKFSKKFIKEEFRSCNFPIYSGTPQLGYRVLATHLWITYPPPFSISSIEAKEPNIIIINLIFYELSAREELRQATKGLVSSTHTPYTTTITY